MYACCTEIYSPFEGYLQSDPFAVAARQKKLHQVVNSIKKAWQQEAVFQMKQTQCFPMLKLTRKKKIEHH